jgi:OFA family oxalate/formate antiporter-like MFS transporter
LISVIENKMKKSEKLFYGWYIVLMAFICNFLGTGTTFYIFNAFIEPLCGSRGWSRTDINMAPMLGYVVMIFGTLIYGTLVIKIGPRILMALGCVFSAASFILLGNSESIYVFYLFFALLYISNGAMSGIVANTAVNNWFVRKRGNALGIAISGVSVAGVILPFAAMMILEKSSLFYAFLIIGIIILAVAPFAWLIIRNRPEDMGLEPDGDKNCIRADEGGGRDIAIVDATGEIEVIEDTRAGFRHIHWPVGKIVREKAFWKIGFAYGLAMMGVVGVMFQLKPRFRDIGFDDGDAMSMMAVTALIGAAGKYVWAMLCDRFSSIKVASILMILNAAGLALALVKNSHAAVISFIIIYGFAMGGVLSTTPVLIADLFGRESFASVARFTGVIIGINCLGYPIMGRSYDITGSYDAAYAVFMFLNIIAAFLVFTLRRPSSINKSS